jgi:hypothetical protein
VPLAVLVVLDVVDPPDPLVVLVLLDVALVVLDVVDPPEPPLPPAPLDVVAPPLPLVDVVAPPEPVQVPSRLQSEAVFAQPASTARASARAAVWAKIQAIVRIVCPRRCRSGGARRPRARRWA